MAANEIHPAVAIHPVTNEMPFFHPGGARISKQDVRSAPSVHNRYPLANSQAHSYCPPAVGYTRQISANDAAIHNVPTADTINPYIIATGPPDGNTNDRLADMAVILFKQVNAIPIHSHAPNVRCMSEGC